MKICFITHDMHPQTGIGVFSRNLIGYIARLRPDWDVSVIVEKSCGDPLETRTSRMDRGELLKSIVHLRGLLKHYDIVQAFDAFPYGLVAVMSTLGLRKTVFITAIGTGSVRMLAKPLFSLLLKFCYKKATAVFALSRYTAGKVQHFMPTLKIIPIYPGISTSEQGLRAADGSLVKHFADKKPYMLTVGTFKPRKGQKQIALGYIEAAKRLPDLNYLLEGDPNNAYGDEIKRLIANAGLSHRVFFLGSISKDMLRVVYSQASLFAMLPQEVPGDSDIEGFGLVFLDAAAAGLPIIASTEGPSAEAVAAGQNAILVDPYDIGAISDSIVKISSDSALHESMSRASVLFAQHMSWSRTARQYLEWYERYGF